MTMRHYPLTSSTIRALTDGSYLLKHPELLSPVALELSCQHCERLGAKSHVTVTGDSVVAQWACGHSAGFIQRRRIGSFGELLMALGWTLRCANCHQVPSGENDPTDARFVVVCPCALRELVNPLARTAAAAPGLSTVAH